MLRCDRKRIKLEINDLMRGLVGNYVEVYGYGCGRIQVRAKGVALPHTILSPDHRITHAAIAENKRLGAMLEHIKAEQDKAPSIVKVKPERAQRLREEGSGSHWPVFEDGALLRPQTRRTRGPRSEPGLRYLRSPPCQAALPSALLVTLLLGATGDISEWRLYERMIMPILMGFGRD